MIDANILIAALLRDSTTRRLIVLGGYELHAPRYLYDEVEAHRDELSNRIGVTQGGLEEALRILRPHVIEHELEEYAGNLGNAQGVLRGRDPKDAPYIALVLSLDADGIWTEDRELAGVKGVRVYRTSELV